MNVQLFIVGLVVGFLFYELTGISPGGVIAPAYLALSVRQPGRIAITIVLALLIYFIIKYLSSHLILYGRRKFLLAIMLGFFFKLLIENQIQPAAWMTLDLQSVGYIIPGLIANEMGRQKVTSTLLSLGIVTLLVFQISLLFL
jgi:gamma-polyglutamate biosynthesis protein CapC